MRIRRAVEQDTPFLVEVICEAEKAGSQTLSYCRIFDYDEHEFRSRLDAMLREDLRGQELFVSDFLVAEVDGRPAGAVAAWVEGSEGVPSTLLKANLLLHGIDRDRMRAAHRHFKQLAELSISRDVGAIQIESVYVRAEFRGHGIAGKLVEQHLAELRSGATVSKAQVILTANNEAASAAYTRMGFLPAVERWSTDQTLLALVPSIGKLLMERSF